MKSEGQLVIGLALMLSVLFSGIAWAEDEVFIRNRPVKDAIRQGGDYYVPLESLEVFFSASELERLDVDADENQILVDGTPVAAPLLPGAPPRFPLFAVADALGFTRKHNKEMATLDLVPPAAMKKKEKIPQTRRGGRDYAIAEGKMRTCLSEDGMSSNADAVARVKKIGDEIVAVSEMPSLIWNFYVTASSTPNAFCTGAGFVAVSEGLLNLNLTDDELAGILAHEVAHGTNADMENATYRQENMASLEGEIAQLRQKEAAIVVQLESLYATMDDLKSKAQIAAQYGDIALYNAIVERHNTYARQARELESMLSAVRNRMVKAADDWRYNESQVNGQFARQSDELDADLQGLRLATAAGFSASGLQMALQKLVSANISQFGTAALAGDYDHPAPVVRLQLMNKVLQDYRASGWRRN